jgi:hypothetical protein
MFSINSSATRPKEVDTIYIEVAIDAFLLLAPTKIDTNKIPITATDLLRK